MRSLQTFLVICLALALAACGTGDDAVQAPPQDATANPEPTEVSQESETAEAEFLVVFLGDSLTAGFGLDVEQSYPALVESQLRERGWSVRAVNAGISGDTTAGGLRRLDWLLRQNPDVLMVALGGNDGLRGVDLESSESHLRQILQKAQEQGVQVLLAGMLIPPNYGADYTEQFASLYPRLAEEFEVPLIPFLLEGVAAQPELNLPDGIHPTAEGQEIVAATVLRHLEPVLEGLRPAP